MMLSMYSSDKARHSSLFHHTMIILQNLNASYKILSSSTCKILRSRRLMSSLSSSSIPTADLCDKYIPSPTRLQIVEPNLFKTYGAKSHFHGKIETVKCFESNPLVRETLSTPGNGGVLVVDGGGSKRCAIMGDMLATFARDNGWSGVLIHGYIRDSKVINGIDIGVKALGTHPLKSLKDYRGEKGLRVSFGGVEFVPGHYLYSDEDGIVVSETEMNLD